MFKISKDKMVNGWQYVQLFILPALMFAAQETFYKVCNIDNAKNPVIKSHILSLAIMCGLFFLILGVLKTTFRASVALSVILFVLMIADQIKIVYSTNPIFLGDIRFLKTPGTFTDILKENIGGILLELTLPIIFMAVVLSLICLLARKFNYVMKSRKIRIAVSVSSLAFILLLFFPITPVNNFVIKAFYQIDEKKNNNTTSNVKYYYQHGFFAGMCGEYLTTILRVPEDYDAVQVSGMLSQVENEEIPASGKKSWGKPNIIMVFSESLFDMTSIDEVEFDRDVLKNFHELSQEGLTVNMISPTFGGISCNPEFEMLTGGSLKFFPENYIPYMNLYTNDKYMNTTSVIGELNNNGYNTHILSMWSKNLFNVENVYLYFGVQQIDHRPLVDEQYKKGGRASDDYVADIIIDAFENKGDEPLFYMALTAQNHMPFTKGKYDSYDVGVESTKLSEEDTGIMLSYAQGVYDADMQLKKLYDYIQSFDEPTMLIFYGDHLPFLNNDAGEDMYDKLSWFDTDDELLDLYRRYNTQCLILDNFNAQYDNISYLGYDLVMSYVLNNMDLDLSVYYKWLYTTIDGLPAANRHVAVDKEGNLYSTCQLPKAMQEVYDKRERVNWNVFVDDY